MRKIFILPILFVFLSVPSIWSEEIPSHPTEIEFPSLDFKIPQPKRVELAGGAVAYLYEDARLPRIHITVYVRAGSVCDPAGQEGAANLTANVMRAGGTKHYPSHEFDELLEGLASRIEIQADKDSATASLWTLSKNFDTTFDALISMLREPAFEEEKFNIEKRKATEEIQRQEDDPMRFVARVFTRLMYKDHPYAHPSMGTLKAVEALTVKDLKKFHGAHYSPADMIFAVTGDFSAVRGKEKGLVAKLNRALKGWKSAGERRQIPSVDTESYQGGMYYVAKPMTQASIRMGHFGIKQSDPDYLAVRVMDYVLGEGSFTSRLQSRVRAREGLAYGVGSYFVELKEMGIFIAVTQTKSASTKRAIDIMIEEIRRMTEEPVTQEELEIAKNSFVNQFPFFFETPIKTVNAFAQLEFFGLPRDYYEKFRERISAVDIDEVLRVAKKYLHPDDMTIVVLGSEKDFDVPLDEWGDVKRLNLEGLLEERISQ